LGDLSIKAPDQVLILMMDPIGGDMETNPQTTEKSDNKNLPLRIGLGFGVAVFIVVVIGTILLQFFLQIGLGGGNLNDPDFYTAGIFLGSIWGCVFGIPIGAVSGFFAGGVTWLIKKQQSEINK
jgi:hypothetical protein